MITKELIEAIKIRHGWTDESVLSITSEDIIRMTKEELEDYIKVSTAIYNSAEEENFDIQEVPVVDSVILLQEEE